MGLAFDLEKESHWPLKAVMLTKSRVAWNEGITWADQIRSSESIEAMESLYWSY
jgi:hypothetical protein